MPADFEIRERRRAAIVEILQQELVHNQQQLVELLRKKGIVATQSSVSRDLRDMGVVPINGIYTLRQFQAVDEMDFRRAVGNIRVVMPAGPHLTVVVTNAAAAPLVARAIDQALWEEVTGTLAGDDTIFIATANSRDQKKLLQRLRSFLS